MLAFKLLEWIPGSLLVVLIAIRASYPQPPPSPQGLLHFLHIQLLESYVFVNAILVGLTLSGKLLQEIVYPVRKAQVKGILDALAETYFKDEPEAQKYFHRVTLFRARLRKRFLVAYCRSGVQYQGGIQWLKINSDNENANEGIAGRAWFTNTTVAVADLPECPDPWNNGDQRCQEYVQRGGIPAKKAARLHVKSRSLLATPVRNTKGAQWGVLVLDSREPDGIDAAKQFLATGFATAISNVL